MNGLAGVVFDLDGVVWRGYEPVPWAVSTIKMLRRLNVKVAFLTNTSSRGLDFLSQKLLAIGIEVHNDDIFNSASLTAQRLCDDGWEGRNVIVVGAYRDLLYAISDAGIRPVRISDAESMLNTNAKVPLVVGYQPDFGMKYAKAVLRISDRVNTLYAPERDRWFGSSSGVMPGAGWVVAACEELLQKKALLVGKPSPYGLQLTAMQWNCSPGEILVVGDSIESDIRAARNSGAKSCLFSPDDVTLPKSSLDVKHDYVIKVLDELIGLMDALARD